MNGQVDVINVRLIINADSNEWILPAYFSDGYFNLLPSEKKVILAEWPEHANALKLRIESYGGSLDIQF